LGILFFNYKGSPHYCATFYYGEGYALILTKMGWATFCVTFFHKLITRGRPEFKTERIANNGSLQEPPHI
jgi:hypothetical protein